MILSGLPWKRKEIILSFFRLHPSIAFETLLLTMMAAPFLPKDSCYGSGYNGHLSPNQERIILRLYIVTLLI